MTASFGPTMRVSVASMKSWPVISVPNTWMGITMGIWLVSWAEMGMGGSSSRFSGGTGARTEPDCGPARGAPILLRLRAVDAGLSPFHQTRRRGNCCAGFRPGGPGDEIRPKRPRAAGMAAGSRPRKVYGDGVVESYG